MMHVAMFIFFFNLQPFWLDLYFPNSAVDTDANREHVTLKAAKLQRILSV